MSLSTLLRMALPFAVIAGLLFGAASAETGFAQSSPQGDAVMNLSRETETCIDCHTVVSPGIVSDWLKSRHARVTVAEAMRRPVPERRISAERVPDELLGSTTGCAECHGIHAEEHPDTFEHAGTRIHTVVTPADCAACHPAETGEYSMNLMAHAYGNLAENALYGALVGSINGVQHFGDTGLTGDEPDDRTDAESCFYCHGTRVQVTGTRVRDTDIGELELPVLSGWPNQGVGRVNPDGSLGCCSSCHTRHRFSIEVARKPATCSECHTGPDVPAYKVYDVSKHGNLYSSQRQNWNFSAVPWVPGKDFSAPTCAVCHASLLATEDGDVIAERTHRMNDRLEWRIFGLPHAHPHPLSPNTTIIRNAAGLPLATELTGEPASRFLIGRDEMEKRRGNLQKVCLACHSSGWVEPQFDRFHHTIETTNEMTLSATKVLSKAWERGLATGPGRGGTPFDEPIEKMWVEQWLFYANSTRFASAMGGADYGAFANGRWNLSKNLRDMEEWVKAR
jgi:hydroxylamine dehydrogenase